MKKLEFQWRDGDIEIVACPEHLVRLFPDEPNVTIDIRKWNKDESGEWCFSIGYFHYNKNEDLWEVKFVGDRFMQIDPKQAADVWRKIGVAYNILNEWKEGTNE